MIFNLRVCFFLSAFLVISVPHFGFAFQSEMRGPTHAINTPSVATSSTVDDSHLSPSNLLLTSVRFFQHHISKVDGDRCSFYPTCSSFGRQAVQSKGAWFGLLLTADRLMRCRDWPPIEHYERRDGHRFYDPVEDNVLEEGCCSF